MHMILDHDVKERAWNACRSRSKLGFVAANIGRRLAATGEDFGMELVVFGDRACFLQIRRTDHKTAASFLLGAVDALQRADYRWKVNLEEHALWLEGGPPPSAGAHRETSHRALQ